MSNSLDKLIESHSKLMKLAETANRLNNVPEGVRQIIEIQNKFKTQINIPNYIFPKYNIPKFQLFENMELLETFRKFSEVGQRIRNNPELQFSFITDIEILNLKSSEELKASLTFNLTDEEIEEKEALLDENLLPYLEELELETLWLGASQVLESKDNIDKLRHCLISLRTILEYLIKQELAPNDKIKDSDMFKKEFKNYHSGKTDIDKIKVSNTQRIEYFTSKFEFGVLEDFTKEDIQYVCNCYSVLCNVHQPDIGITENQVRSLKVKTGITIWLLVYLNKTLTNE